MSVSVYLLDLQKLEESEYRSRFLAMAPSLVDEERLRKAEKIKDQKSRAVSLSAGLLLQKAVAEVRGKAGMKEAGITKTEVLPEELLSQEKDRVSLTYRYGQKGKPYLMDSPLFFNLSHSGRYVLCGISFREIGVDIQEIRKGNLMQIVKRYFAGEEVARLEKIDDETLRKEQIYTLWARKEAYGKLTGEGIATTIGVDLYDRAEAEWIPFEAPVGYAAAICVGRMI